jgi:very-short-patch-repair endonuclease
MGLEGAGANSDPGTPYDPMGSQTVPTPGRAAWAIAKRDQNIVSRAELLEVGFHPKAIEHRVKTKRLHPQARGVYSVGSPHLTKYGRWMVAVKRCGPGAVLSFLSAAVLWGLWEKEPDRISVTVPRNRRPRAQDMTPHRRDLPRRALTRHHGIPVTSVVQTLIDLATILTRDQLERVIGQADAKNVIRADALRERLETEDGRGARTLKETLDRDSFVLSHSELERLFIPLAERAGLPRPESQRQLGSARVDFYWPELNLVVECDSLRYHRTQLQQAEDRARDHAHLLAGRTCLRFTHHQVAHEPGHVVAVLASTRTAQPAAGSPC